MAVVLIAATIVLLAYHITSYYGIYNQMMKENQEETEKQMLLSEDFLGQFLRPPGSFMKGKTKTARMGTA